MPYGGAWLRAPGPRPALFGAAVLAAGSLFLAVRGCGPDLGPPASGRVMECPAGFALTVPDGWDVRSTPRGFRLVHRSAVGRGYPVLQIERLPVEEAGAPVAGRGFRHPLGRGEYRASRWANPSGHGFRLDAEVRTGDAVYRVRGDVWDEGLGVRDDLFDTLFWPVVGSMRATDPAAPPTGADGPAGTTGGPSAGR